MSCLFEQILSTLRAHTGDAEFFFQINPEWSSRHEGHRLEVRQEVMRALQLRGWSLPNHLLEPGSLPSAGDPPMSVSHCPLAGGFALTAPARNVSLGFDLEAIERVTAPIVSRISEPKELAIAPDLASLWVAKEASYKALPRSIQPLVTSQIEIGGWLTLGQNFYRFNAGLKGSQHFGNAHGFVVDFDSLKMGFFVYPT
jgi:phosphopantetheinyl transferase (holo-ACP synthase)